MNQQREPQEEAVHRSPPKHEAIVAMLGEAIRGMQRQAAKGSRLRMKPQRNHETILSCTEKGS